jgi:hypothetical protein
MMKGTLRKAFENVREQIGFCGIWCGSCVVGNGTLRELTERYEEIIGAYGLEEWAPRDFDYKEFLKGLTSIRGMPLCPGCLKGGGRDNCEMKACASNKNIDDCSECHESAACKHVEILQTMRSGALAAGLFVKTEEVDRQQLIEEWTAELKSQWPCCILFMNGQ